MFKEFFRRIFDGLECFFVVLLFWIEILLHGEDLDEDP